MSIPEFQKRVFIFGAGASVNSGAPLMTNFLDKAEYLYRGLMVDRNYVSQIHAKEHFQLVFEALDSMQSLHSKSNIDLDNIEDVFGAFEIANIIKQLGSFPTDKIEGLSMAASILIAYTLEHTCEFKRGANGFMPQGDYRRFIEDLIKDSVLEKDGTRLFQNNTFITFNYDVCLDAAIHYHGFKIDYGLRDFTEPSAVKLFKLHGSINWAECLDSNCGQMFAIDLSDYVPKLLNACSRQVQAPITDYLFFTPEYHEYRIKYNVCNCANAARKYKPVIVPPTWNKTSSHQKVRNVWKHAAEALGEAEYIYVIGYSLPETDVFFRLLYALGSESGTRLKKFLVINPDETARSRFDKIVSQGRIHRYDFKKEYFSDSIDTLFDCE